MLSTWMPVTREALADAPAMSALIEYSLSDPRPLTIRERLTGWRAFTSRDGYTIRMRVGWRLVIDRLKRPVNTWRQHRSDRLDDDE